MDSVYHVLFGSIIGIITGITPGLHVNTLLTWVSGYTAIGIAISHTFFDFIPSLLLGLPDESSSVASLPGHRLVMRGRGHEAFLLSVIGGTSSVIALVPLLIIATFASISRQLVLALLVGAVLLMIFHQRNVLLAVIVFILSASVSLLVSPFSPEVLPVYFSGLFGIPIVVDSLLMRSKIPKQKRAIRIHFDKLTILLSSLGGLFAGLMPGITSSVSAVSINSFFNMSDEDKVMLVGGINTAYVITSILAIWVIGRPRSGVAIAVKSLGIGLIPYLFMGVSFSALLALYIGPLLFDLLSRTSLRTLNVLGISSLFFISLILYPAAIPVLILSGALGLICVELGVNRSLGLGFIILPIVINYACGI